MYRKHRWLHNWLKVEFYFNCKLEFYLYMFYFIFGLRLYLSFKREKKADKYIEKLQQKQQLDTRN